MTDRLRFTPELALSLWRLALDEEIGLAIPIDPKQIDRIRPVMYQVRKEANEPDLQKLMLCVGPRQEELWLVKKTVEIE